MEQALEQSGVNSTTLTDAEKSALDNQGYLVIPGLADGDWLAQLQGAFERAVERAEKGGASNQGGTRHVNDLAAGDEAFDRVVTNPKVLAAAFRILGRPFRLFQLAGRDPLPGFGQQGLHNDWTPRRAGDPYSIVTALWLLDDFLPNNGATRLLPGSHRIPRGLSKSMQAPESHHPDERLITANAGSVLVFNGHLWHSGTRNNSNLPRRILQCQFAGREIGRSAVMPAVVPERLGTAARFILGI